MSTTEVLALSTSKDNVIPAAARVAVSTERGGSFLGKMGKMLHKGLHVLKHVKPEHLQMAQDGLKSLGIGGDIVGGDTVGGQVVAGKLRKHRRVL